VFFGHWHFGVVAVIAGIGAVAIKQEKSRSHRVFALVPLLFAAQQVAEGILSILIVLSVGKDHRLVIAPP